MDYYISVLKNYAVFSGRAHRKEFWLFVLINFIAYAILNLIDGIISGNFGILTSIYALAVLVPSLAVSMRRLHDTDRSGWWLLFGLIPIIGWITFLVFAIQDGTSGENRFGPNPKNSPPTSPTPAEPITTT